MTKLQNDKIIILFDGICNLCESSVQFIIKHDKNDIFRFVSLQSNLGFEICNHLKIETKNIDSIIYYEPKKSYSIKSKAAFKIAEKLKFPYKFILIFSVLPYFITDFIYDIIAKNRYKWFGKKENCLFLNETIKQKFLD